DASVINRVVLNAENADAGECVLSKRVLRRKRIVASPAQAKFVQHPRTENPVVADRCSVSLETLPSERRRARTVDDAAESTGDESVAAGINVSHEQLLTGIEARVSAGSIAVIVIRQGWNTQVVVCI